MFLARHLERTIAYPDLAWWELRLTFPLLSIWTGLAAAIVVGSASGIAAAWIAGSAPVGVLIGLMLGGLAAGAITLKRSWEPTRDIRWKPPGFGVATIVVAVAMVAGILLGLLVYNRQGIAGPIAAWVLGSGSFLAIGFGIWLVVQEGTPLDMSSPSSPPIWLAMDRKMAILGAFIAGFGLLATVVLVVAVSSLIAGGEAAQAAVEALLLAAGPAVVVGIAACFKGAWAYYGIARTCLALRRRLPWHLMIFLSDAHERSVLRQVGALYQFRHIDLQHRLATRVPEVARIGSYSHFRDIGGEIYRVALMRIVDPAQGVDRLNVPDTGKRFVGAIFRIKARNGSLQGEDANNDVTVIGNNGESYRADVQEIAGYPKFDTAKLHVMQEGTATCAVTFQIPDDVKIEWAQWTTTSGFQPTVRWHAGQGQGIRRLWFASIARIGSVATSLYRRRNRMS